MRNLDLFSGIGGFTYAGEKLVGGITTTQFVENNKFCQKILRKHWPDIPIHDDIRTFNAKKYEYDSITAGFPCQDLSVAGKQRGIGEGTRSSLFYEVIRLVRQIRPKFILLENVRNLLSHQNGETFQEILFQIAKAGYDAEWSVISARDVGACHKRERLWIIAYPQSQSSNVKEFKSFFNKESHKSESRNSNIEFTNSNINGSSSTKRLRVNGKADSNTQERQDKISKSQRSGKPRNSRVIQQTPKWRETKHRLNPNWKRYVSKPSLCRGDDGLRNRVDRLKSLGNSIVPAVAAVPLQRIKDLNEYFSTIT